ncbi:two-component system histidine kinase PnpS [Clostridium sp. DL1XJH146]
MKKKLMVTFIGTVVLSLFVVTLLFVALVNFQNEEGVKEQLKLNNQLVINRIDSGVNYNNVLSKQFTKDISIRTTFIDEDGTVIAETDSDAETMENHNDRKEVIEARLNGNGSNIRYSETLNKTMIYYATLCKNGSVVRSSLPLDEMKGIVGKYTKYYLVVLVIVLLISIIISSKLTYVVVKPIRDLEEITHEIAEGNFDKRAKKYSDDEIGELAVTFNKMANKLQDTLKDSNDKQNKLEAILRSMDSGVIAIDTENFIIMFNPYAKNIFELEYDVIGRKIENILNKDAIDNLINTKEGINEISISLPSEKILKVIKAKIISENTKIGTVIVLNDITDIKKLENMRSQFVANVSHELKTPLTSIKGFSETLKYVEDKETKDKFLNIIDIEADRLTRLINDILILSDMEQFDANKEKSEFRVNASIEEVLILMKPAFEKKNIKLNYKFDKDPILLGNRDSFKQIIINLVDNAIKYSENNDMITIKTQTDYNKMIIRFKDTGCGIPEKDIPRLFERFYRVDKARSRARGGTGLGLAIVKHSVLNFEGTINVESKVGEGTEFIVEVPIVHM